MKDSLLDYLTDLADCGYVSNLRWIALNEEQRKVFLTLPDDAYSLEEYAQSLSYIIGKRVELQSVETGKQQIVTALSKSKV